MAERRNSAPRKPIRGASVSPYRKGEVALERAFSKLGLGSRTQAREWILAGRVSVAGRVVRDPRFGVVPETARIVLDGEKLERARSCTIVFHKPRGVVTTLRDEKGRPTIFSVLKDLPESGLMPVGRLDQNTSGLLLLTNDSRFSDWVLNPENAVPRVYLVEVRGLATDSQLQAMIQGVTEAGEVLIADGAEILKASGKESRLLIRLCEGKNREVRRLCASVGLPVQRLKRIQLGGLELGTLPVGQWRELEMPELLQVFPGCSVRSQR
jgi:23S rRNA pseudouridine2605 synthase